MVFCSNGQVFHASILCRLYPAVRIEQHWIELLVETVVFPLLDFTVSRPTYFSATQRNWAPMDEHAKPFGHKIINIFFRSQDG